VWVEGLLPCQLQEIEMNSTDETELARQIFIKLFARELEEKPNEIYCTEVNGKELLNQSWIRGICCKYLFYTQLYIVHTVVGNSLPCCSDVYLHGFPTDCVNFHCKSCSNNWSAFLLFLCSSHRIVSKQKILFHFHLIAHILVKHGGRARGFLPDMWQVTPLVRAS